MAGEALYTAAQTRELDRITIEEFGVPGIRLMSRAGRTSFDLLCDIYPDAEHIQVFCGTGNNGGDGFIVASLAHERGVPVTVYLLGDAAKISGDARLAYDKALVDGVAILPFAAGGELTGGVIVDAMLGTGLSGDVRGDYPLAIELINASSLPVLAVDIPSGLCSDTGKVLGDCVRADHTATFIGIKRGLMTGEAPAKVGLLHFTDLEVPLEVYGQVPANSYLLELEDLRPLIPRREQHAHKGMFGHALIVGGDEGLGGAAIMAAEAAGRCGAGLVSAATRPGHVSSLLTRIPEVMARGVAGGNELLPMLERPNAIAVGPGLGSSPWSEQLLFHVLETDKPLVVDADALNLLAENRIVEIPRRDNWVLTPHPGEAARLLQCSTADINADRFAAVFALQQRYGGVVLLKGAGTLVCGGEEVFLCPYGNPGMASGGMGDVLSGVIAALLAQGLSPLDAACLGVCLHGCAADVAAAEGAVGLLATDLMPALRQLLGS